MKLPTWLSEVPEKRILYSVDPYFREAWADLVEAWGEPEQSSGILRSTALLVLRPDAVVARSSGRIVRALLRNGFTPAACAEVYLDPVKVRENWRYELVASTPVRERMLVDLLGAGRSLVLMLRRPVEGGGSAARLLHDLKGPGAPQSRRPEQLRSIAGGPPVSVLTHVHSSDEMADVVRELGVLLDCRARSRLLGAVARGVDATIDTFSAVRRLEAGEPQRDFDLALAEQRVAAALRGVGDQAGAARLGGLARGLALPDLAWLTGLRRTVPAIDPWDALTVAAWHCPPHPAGPDAFAQIRAELIDFNRERIPHP